MDYYRIKGGKKLKGQVRISGAKNAALPVIVASLLADGETVLKNVPDLKDIRTIIKVIEYYHCNRWNDYFRPINASEGKCRHQPNNIVGVDTRREEECEHK